jgi:GNAT superfamily N-acetyltransferase
MKLANLKLRGLESGDLGWVIQQHGQIYAQEYQWDTSFEVFVAKMMAGYVEKFNPEWERFWMAELSDEQGAQRVGSVFVARKSKTVAQLRALILTPESRGLGLGGRLVDECIAFSRSKGYRKLVLWTNSCLDDARALYAKRGFKLTASESFHGFGHDLIGETWQLKL